MGNKSYQTEEEGQKGTRKEQKQERIKNELEIFNQCEK
jgi:hypothetical protein